MYNGQILQDNFVNIVMNGKREGFFLDIGAGQDGLRGKNISFFSNTFFLESLDWSGIVVDYDPYFIERASTERNCLAICVDLMNQNITEILNKNHAPKHMDYLSFDVDDATLKTLLDFDFEKYSFNIITFEHNIYFHENRPTWVHPRRVDEAVKLRTLSRDIFLSHDYELLCSDVVLDGHGAVEDWYVSKNILDERIKKMKCSYKNCKDIVKETYA